jgi:hypothetical protein
VSDNISAVISDLKPHLMIFKITFITENRSTVSIVQNKYSYLYQP